jgi:hypothetical protein
LQRELGLVVEAENRLRAVSAEPSTLMPVSVLAGMSLLSTATLRLATNLSA